MSKMIIGFSGSANSGKTKALHRLISILENTQVISDQDLVKVISYKGKNIGISTGGDYKDHVTQSLSTLVPECDIVITACRTYGGTHDAIDAWQNISTNITYISCPYFSPQKVRNKDIPKNELEVFYEAKARMLLSYLDSLIS
ncbi:Uncharacterised protein [Phocoenobacter uteri]|uniref:Uncharacterized protein n=1 Tax=Phocoenobacter uteri TaxID=146806 RepID=A0A379C9I8_9PAST|nr:hypothetical protein [Phocoenobacter uteri]MDG6882623.1 hypothetical protein [Phocoenobacter uteri]SUB58788.1 Uncharacterised protein [Phocoenobacter uteri]